MHRALAFGFLLCACASSPVSPRSTATRGSVATASVSDVSSASKQPVAEIRLEPILIETEISPVGVASSTATDARGLFDAGNQALVAGHHREALRTYERLQRDFPRSRLGVLALYNAGLALEGLGRLDDAVARYLAIVHRAGGGRDSRDAHMRAVSVLAELERWSEAGALVSDFLARKDLSTADRVEALARKGYVLLESGDYAAAELELRAGTNAAKSSSDVARGYFAAMCHFYLGEIPRRQFAVLPVRLPESQMTKDLNHKAELVLLARERYNAAIATGHLYWATASGYQIAAMQAEFRDAIVLAPVPTHLNEEAVVIYEQRVHKEARRFLHKALRVHQQTVELARVHRTTTPWSEAARTRAEQITELLAHESSGRLVKPASLGGHSGITKQEAPDGYAPARTDL